MNVSRLSLRWAAALCAGALLATGAWAQAPRNPARAAVLDADLFPPDLVMRFQRDIELTDEQSAAILKAAQETQGEMLEVQWELSPELEELRGMLSRSTIDEDAVRAQLARVTETEAKAKELQLMLMVRVKNTLTQQQQSRLRKLREEHRPTAPRRRGNR